MALLRLHYDPSQTISPTMEQSKILCRCLTWSLIVWKRRVGGRDESEISANPRCPCRRVACIPSTRDMRNTATAVKKVSASSSHLSVCRQLLHTSTT